MPHSSFTANDSENASYQKLAITAVTPILANARVVGRNDGTNAYYRDNYPRLFSSIMAPEDAADSINGIAGGGGVSVFTRLA